MAEINLNNVKDFEIGSSKIDMLNLDGIEVWRKVTASITETSISGGIRLTATKSVDPLKHNLYFKKKATDQYGTTNPIDITTADSGTAYAAVGTDLDNIIYETSYAWSTAGSQATKPTITETNIAGGKKYTFTNNETSGTLYYSTNGTSWTQGTEYQVKSVTSGVTLYVKVTGVSGKMDSDSSTKTINVPAATASISVANVSGGKKITITNTSGSGTMYYLFSGSSFSSTTDASKESTINTQTSGTAKVYVTGALGMADTSSSSAASTSWKVAKLDKPSASVSNLANGQRATFSCTTATYSDGTSDTGLSPSYSITASSTSVTKSGNTATLVSTSSAASATVYASCSLAGYVSSSNSDTKTLSVTASTCTITYDSTQATANAASYTITGTAGGTLQYKIGSGSWTNYTSSVTVTGRQTIYAQNINVPAQTVSTANATVPYATSPTITESSIDGGKRATASSSQTGTLQMSTDGSNWSNVTYLDFKTVSTTTVYARIINVKGYANSQNATKSVSVSSVGTLQWNSWSAIAEGYYAQCVTSSIVSGATITVTGVGSNKGPTSGGSGTAPNILTCYATGTTGTYQFSATAKLDGYVPTTLNMTSSVTVSKLTAPTITKTGTLVSNVGGADFSVANADSVTGGTLQYKWGNGSWTNYSSKVNETTAGTFYARYSKSGYITSDSSSSTLSAITAPTCPNGIENYGDAYESGKKATFLTPNVTGAGIVVTGATSTGSAAGGVTAFMYTVGSFTLTATAYASGYANSSIQRTATVTKLSDITVSSVSNITGGKKCTFTKPTTDTAGTAVTTTLVVYGADSTSVSGNVTTANVTHVCTNATISAVAWASGYVRTTASQTFTVSVATAPTVTTVNGSSIGKHFRVTANVAGDINWTIAGTAQTKTTKAASGYVESSDYSDTTSRTCNAWMTGVSGMADGSASSGNASITMTLTKASTPTVTSSNITSGKSFTVTKGTNGATVQSSTNGSSWTTRTSGTAFNVTNSTFSYMYGRAYGPGYAYSDTASVAGITTASAPTVTATNHSSGGKYFSISSSVGGTINFTVTGGLSQTGTGSSTNRWANTTATTCNAWVTGASGYADASSTVNNKSASATLSVATKPASVSAADSNSGGKYFSITNGGEGGTINWKMSGGNTASGTGASSSNWTNTTATTCNAWMTNVPGKADASATTNNTTSSSVTLTAATSPSIGATDYLSGKTGGKTFSLTNNETTGTMQYQWNSTSGSWTNYPSAVTYTSVGTIYARVVNVKGKANSGNSSSTVSSVGTLQWNSWTAITDGYYAQCVTTGVVSGAAISVVGAGSNKGPTSGASGTAPNMLTCYATGTPGTYQFSATAYKSGYVSTTLNNTAQIIYQLVEPTKQSWLNISGGKQVTFTNPGKYYNSGSSGASTAVTGTTLNVTATSGCSVSGAVVTLTTATSTNQNASGSVSKTGYVTSKTTTTDNTTLSAATAPSITINRNAKTFSITSADGGTINYSSNGGTNYSTGSSVSGAALPTSNTSSSIKAYVTGVSGKATSSTSTRNYQVITGVNFYDVEPSIGLEEACLGYYYSGSSVPVLGFYNGTVTSYSATIILDGTNGVTARTPSALGLTAAAYAGTPLASALGYACTQAWWNNETAFVGGSSYTCHLTSIKLISSCTQILDYALNGVNTLTTVYNTGSNLTTIGSYAFYGCSNLTTLPSQGSTVTSIGSYGLYYCLKLTSFNFSSCTSIGGYAFRYDGLTSVSLPKINTMGNGVFLNNTSLTSYSQTGGTRDNVPSETCNACTKLSSITLHSGITSIADSAFKGCTSLTSIDFTTNGGTSITQIGSQAFYYCTGLTSVKFPASLAHNSSTTSIYSEAFRGCSSLSTVDFLALGDNFKYCVIGANCWTGCVIRTAKISKGNFSSYLRRYTYSNSRLGCRAGGGIYNYWTKSNNTKKAETYVITATTAKNAWVNAYYYYSSTKNRTTNFTCYTYGGGNGAACSGDSTAVTNWNAKKYCAIATTCTSDATEDTRVYGMGWSTFNFNYVSNDSTCGYRFTTMGRDVFNGGDYICGNNSTPWNDFGNWYSPDEINNMAYVNDCLYPNEKLGLGWTSKTFDELVAAGTITSSYTALCGTKLDMMIPIYKNWQSIYS